MTPIAFNLAPRLKACLPGDTRYSTLLALYEALQEAAVFEMAAAPDIKAETVADPDRWIPHKAGDPMPCDGDMMVEYKMRRGNKPAGPSEAKMLNWLDSLKGEPGTWVITHWRPAQSEK